MPGLECAEVPVKFARKKSWSTRAWRISLTNLSPLLPPLLTQVLHMWLLDWMAKSALERCSHVSTHVHTKYFTFLNHCRYLLLHHYRSLWPKLLRCTAAHRQQVWSVLLGGGWGCRSFLPLLPSSWAPSVSFCFLSSRCSWCLSSWLILLVSNLSPCLSPWCWYSTRAWGNPGWWLQTWFEYL